MSASTPELRVAQVAKRGNKFAIVAGRAILAKFKTVALAQAALEANRGFYAYWAGSITVSVRNTPPVFIYVD